MIRRSMGGMAKEGEPRRLKEHEGRMRRIATVLMLLDMYLVANLKRNLLRTSLFESFVTSWFISNPLTSGPIRHSIRRPSRLLW